MGTLTRMRAENEIEAEYQRQADIIRTTNKIWTVNRAGELLLNRPDFAIHAFKSHSHDFSGACDQNSRSFSAAILIKDETTRLTRDYVEQIFADELIPLASAVCAESVASLSAQFFFKGVQLDDIARRFETSTFSTEFDFIEMAFLIVSAQTDATAGNRGYRLEWFNYHRPNAEAQPYYESLAGLEHIRHQEFMSDREWAAVQKERADRAARLAQAERDAVLLAGFSLEGGGGIGLITGVEPDAYFESNRRDLVEAVMGYSIGISQLCPSSTIPHGGATIVSYSSQSFLEDPDSGQRRANGPLIRRTFAWPVDYYDIAQRVVNVDNASLSGWLDEAERTVYFRDVEKMVALRGCGSDGLRNYHENLRDVTNRVGGDWHDFSSLFGLYG